MSKRQLEEDLTTIIANNLATFMRSDMPDHAVKALQVAINQNTTRFSVLPTEAFRTAEDLIRPRTADEIEHAAKYLMREPVFRARVLVIVTTIMYLLDKQEDYG